MSRRLAVAVTVAAAVAVAAFVPAACGGDDDFGAAGTAAASNPATTPTGAPVVAPTTEVSEMTSIPAADASQDPVASAAVADLAGRLHVSAGDISVASVERGVWTDGSLGCPRPGTAYTQALVPGVRVGLVHDAVTYWYHQGGAGDVFWCAEPAAGAFRGSAGDELVPPPGYTG